MMCGFHYQVGFTSDGKILSLDLQIFLNSGKGLDLSYGVSNKIQYKQPPVYTLFSFLYQYKVNARSPGYIR